MPRRPNVRMPIAEPGLVFRYDYIRPWEVERGFDNGKERPACVLVVLQPGEIIEGVRVIDELLGTAAIDFRAREGDVIILPIQSDKPGKGQVGIELDLETKTYIGLSVDKPSYILLSEMNIDRWPNAGMKPVRDAGGAWVYRRPVPAPVFSRLAKAFLELRRLKAVPAIVRTP